MKSRRSQRRARKTRRSRKGGSSALIVNPQAPPPPFPVFKPGPGQFGYQDPNKVDLHGSFTEYQLGLAPGVGIRGYTNPGQSITQMQHVGLTGIPQGVGIAGALLVPEAQRPLTFDPAQAPPDYYGVLGIERSQTQLNSAVVNSAYAARKNLGTNADKKLVQTAYNTLRDPAARYQYDATVNQYWTSHPPSIAQIMQMTHKANPGRATNPNNALKAFAFLPGFKRALEQPVIPGQ